jgi:hypothetical protein
MVKEPNMRKFTQSFCKLVRSAIAHYFTVSYKTVQPTKKD